ncbi:UDP-N-acetylglucosamine transferase subunit ALG13 homolog [Ischnura elegans]|uniref:UDP-N-acetylglucosamine transferase subunit ALG13 homolog n=1 Tax=Ischnura elegans TaxID=197161 RepID=UPI001ED87270|nr:UDP-N-acetylglucosamine transferase subunit ALG13 homolog [Ischnura elegans]
MASRHIFVTVGSTKFDPFISQFFRPELLQVLKQRGYESLHLQIGDGEIQPVTTTMEGIHISSFRFLPSIAGEIERADLVLSHAGAGTCLEVLNARKPLVAVVNKALMDDHQMELAERLAADGHLIYCDGPEKLLEVLEEADFSKLIPFPPGEPQKFTDFLDGLMGFKLSR